VVLISPTAGDNFWKKVIRQGGYDVLTTPLEDSDVVETVQFAYGILEGLLHSYLPGQNSRKSGQLMSKSVNVARPIKLTLLLVALLSVVNSQSSLADLKAEHDAAKRCKKALIFAALAFDNADEFYAKGEIEKGDAQLEDMTNALNECVGSLTAAREPSLYKKTELKVAYVQRRMQGLVDGIAVQNRGWAEYTERKLDEIHDRLLAGVMKK
jgi:hypothetical protein